MIARTTPRATRPHMFEILFGHALQAGPKSTAAPPEDETGGAAVFGLNLWADLGKPWLSTQVRHFPRKGELVYLDS